MTGYATYLETSPAGFPRLVIVSGELIDPLVVFSTKLERLAEPLFETKRNCPVECIARATGWNPVLRLAGFKAVNVPWVALMRKPKT